MTLAGFFGNDGLKLHILHAHSDEKNFPCTGYDDCEKTFKNKYILDVHIRRVHLKERNYTCPTCGNGKVFHLMISINFDSNYSTLITGFFTPSEMKYHVKAKHEKF